MLNYADGHDIDFRGPLPIAAIDFFIELLTYLLRDALLISDALRRCP